MRLIQWISTAILIVGLLLACAPAREAPKPTVIAKWAVEGSMVTEPFTITEAPWSVSWEFIPSTLNFFQIDIKYSDGRFYSKPIATTTTYNLALSDTVLIHDKGTFYLEIDAEGGVVEVWVIGYGEMNR